MLFKYTAETKNEKRRNPKQSDNVDNKTIHDDFSKWASAGCTSLPSAMSLDVYIFARTTSYAFVEYGSHD